MSVSVVTLNLQVECAEGKVGKPIDPQLIVRQEVEIYIESPIAPELREVPRRCPPRK